MKAIYLRPLRGARYFTLLLIDRLTGPTFRQRPCESFEDLKVSSFLGGKCQLWHILGDRLIP